MENVFLRGLSGVDKKARVEKNILSATVESMIGQNRQLVTNEPVEFEK